MTTATLTYTSVLRLPRVNWKLICFFGALFSVLLLVYYIYQVNQLTLGIYTIKNYEKKIETVSKENSSLESTFAESSFLGGVMEKTQKLNFQKTTAVKYAQILENSVAISQNNIK